jgi:hypothetical protein
MNGRGIDRGHRASVTRSCGRFRYAPASCDCGSRVVVDAQRRAVLEDDAPRAFNLNGEQIEWILEPADFKLLAIERAGVPESRCGKT